MKARGKPRQNPTPRAQQPPAPRETLAAAWPRWLSLLAAATLVAMVVVAYWPALSAGFVWDDDYNLLRNPTLLSTDGLRQIWFEPDSVQQYYPLMYTTFWAEYRLWGFDPLGYHAVNIAIQALAAVLLWRLLRRLSVPGAWLAAAIFAVHPVMVESVAWVTERKNVMSLAFALAAMLCYGRFAPFEPPDLNAVSARGRWRWYTAALLLFALALFSKTAVVTLPAVLLVLYWWKRGRVGRAEAAPLVPFFALAIAAGLITVWMELYHCGARGEEWSLSPVERVLLAGRAMWFYAGKLVWPHPLVVFFYPRWDVSARLWWQYLFPAAAVALPVCLWLVRRRIGRGPLAAILIFGGVLLPAVGLINVYYMQFAYVADHFQYHAAIALIALAAAGAALGTRRCSPSGRRWAQVAAAGLLIVLMAATFRQTYHYRDLETVYRHILAHNPRCWMAYINLMTCLQEQNRNDESLALADTCLAHLQEAGVAGKYSAKAHQSAGFLLMELGRQDEAARHFAQALEVAPDDPHALYGLGMARAVSGQWSAAQECFQRALELDPENADGLYGMGLVLSKQGRLAEGIQYFHHALEINPSDPPTHCELANALALQGNLRESEQHYLTSIQLRPQQPFALHNLGVVLIDLGEPERAIGYLHESLRLNPDNAGTQASLLRAREAALHRKSR